MNTIDPIYLTKLKENIPILDDSHLWSLIEKYVNLINGIEKLTDKNYQLRIKDIDRCIEDIDEYLKDVHKSTTFSINRNMKVIKKNIVYKKQLKNSSEILKQHELKTSNLVEAIIQFTLHYYDNKVTLLSSLHKKNGKLWQVMPYSENKTLTQLILSIAESSDSDNHKNKQYLKQLILVANKLNDLQGKCGFIHGDLHSDNILVNEVTDDIQFIDFGYSYIHLPAATKLTIFVPTNENLNGHLTGIFDSNQSKSVDLFRFIEVFIQDEQDILSDKFKNLVKQISERYFRNCDESIYRRLPNRKEGINESSAFRGLHIPYSRSWYFLSDTVNKALPSSFIYLSPSEFGKFTLGDDNLLKHPLDSTFLKKVNRSTIEKKSRDLFSNSNSSPFKRIRGNIFGKNSPVKPGKFLFGNLKMVNN